MEAAQKEHVKTKAAEEHTEKKATKKIGLIVRADETGLGYQTLAYYKHLKPHKVLLVDISSYNGNKQHYDWYPGAQICKGMPNRLHFNEFLEDVDVVLTAETPYNYELYSMARERNIKTACVYNYEFFDWFAYPEHPHPDILIAPSMWNFDIIDKWAKDKGVKHVYLHHPVDREDFPFIERTTKKIFHIAGKPAAHDRNGTWDYLAADPQGKVITQNDDLAWHIRRKYRMSNVFTGVSDPSHMYQMGDVLAFPRKYGGNCLPLNEALSSGIPVIMPDIVPNNVILPPEWLVPARVVDKFKPRTEIDIYQCDPDALHGKIEWFKKCDIAAESRKADQIAETISWSTLKDFWIKVLTEE